MSDKQIVRRVRRLGVTYDPDEDSYLVSVHWESLNNVSYSWMEETSFFSLDSDELLPFSEEFLSTDSRIKKMLARQAARRASRHV